MKTLDLILRVVVLALCIAVLYVTCSGRQSETCPACPTKGLVMTEEETPPRFPEDVVFAHLLTSDRPGGKTAPWQTLTCSDTDMKQIIIQVPRRHLESGWVKVDPGPSADTISLLQYCCEPPYPKDWNYCPYCGQHLRHNRFERELQRLEVAEKGEKE